jgi:hypothetical protein
MLALVSTMSAFILSLNELWAFPYSKILEFISSKSEVNLMFAADCNDS